MVGGDGDVCCISAGLRTREMFGFGRRLGTGEAATENNGSWPNMGTDREEVKG